MVPASPHNNTEEIVFHLLDQERAENRDSVRWEDLPNVFGEEKFGEIMHALADAREQRQMISWLEAAGTRYVGIDDYLESSLPEEMEGSRQLEQLQRVKSVRARVLWNSAVLETGCGMATQHEGTFHPQDSEKLSPVATSFCACEHDGTGRVGPVCVFCREVMDDRLTESPRSLWVQDDPYNDDYEEDHWHLTSDGDTSQLA